MRKHGCKVYQSARPHTVAREVSRLFVLALLDRGRLRAAGDPVPEGRITLYRGVSGRGRARRVRGISWTGTLDCARWFAGRGGAIGNQADPAVYRLELDADEVLAHLTNRSEDEYLVALTRHHRPARLEAVTPELFDVVTKRWREERS